MSKGLIYIITGILCFILGLSILSGVFGAYLKDCPHCNACLPEIKEVPVIIQKTAFINKSCTQQECINYLDDELLRLKQLEKWKS